MKYLWTILVALVFGLIGKGIGRVTAKTYFTDSTSKVLTVAMHRAALKKGWRGAIAAFAVWLLMLCLSSLIARWITTVGWIPLIVLNCCLGILAGTAASLAALLDRPAQWEHIQALIDERERLIKYLKRFLPIVVAVLFAGIGQALAGADCAVVIDPTDSVSAVDAAAGTDFLKDTIVEVASTFACQHIVTVKVGCDVRFAARTWLDVPSTASAIDCSTVAPKPLSGHSTVWGFVRGIVDFRKEEEVKLCEANNAKNKAAHDALQAAFLDEFSESVTSNDHPRCSRITELVANLAASALYSTIIVVTDAIDNPAPTLNRLSLPPGVHVILVLARPNPEYDRPGEGLARAAGWAEMPGVTVVTVPELRPDYWRATFSRTSR
jgi:hypothetical protein